ncbi:MAG: Hydroxypyruvate isomerase [Spirochaetes bacterium ADurb.Bin110]|nr:MAG: Hydroxypyruvate isomerase [Spirochaetes bacterium ADurb.Bin110]
MMKPSICIEMLYPGNTPEEKIEKIVKKGFYFLEFWGWKDKDLKALISTANKCGASFVNLSGQRKGDLINASTHPVIEKEIKESVSVAKKLGAHILMILSNELDEEGHVLHICESIPDETKRSNIVLGLRRLLNYIPNDFIITLEPLNTVLDHKGYYLNSMEDAVSIIEDVGDPRLRILCDFYHLAMMGEDPLSIVDQYFNFIGHIHIADYPGRHEPKTGNGQWKDVLLALQEKRYKGYVGFEFSPASDSDASLDSVHQLWEEVFGSVL